MSVAKETHQSINHFQRENEPDMGPQQAMTILGRMAMMLSEQVDDDREAKSYNAESTKYILEMVARVRMAGYRLADIHRYDADLILDDVMNRERNKKKGAP